MRQCYTILGDKSFCKYDNNRINKSLFTSWAIVLYYYNLEDDVIKMKKELIERRYFGVLQHDGEFFNSITSSTGSRRYILYSIETIRRIMEECYDF